MGEIHYTTEVINDILDQSVVNTERIEETDSYVVSAKSFGATGDGVTDDRAAIQAAIDYALPRGMSVKLEEGVYLLESFTDAAAYNHLVAQRSDTFAKGESFRIWGQGKAKLVSGSSVVIPPTTVGDDRETAILYLSGSFDSPSITNVHFLNENPYSPEIVKMGIKIRGGSTSSTFDTTIGFCEFDDFSRCVNIAGCTRILVVANRFMASKGRDGGSGSYTNPCVAIWAHANANGVTREMRIINNYSSGYSGVNGIATDAPVTKAAKDGFFLGVSDGGIITGNYIENFHYEGIFVRDWNYGLEGLDPKSNSALMVYNNIVDGKTVPNSKNFHDWEEVDPPNHYSNWAIRCDQSNTQIANNVMCNTKHGILVLPDWDDTNDISVVGNVMTLDNSNFNGTPIRMSIEGAEFGLNRPVVKDNVINSYYNDVLIPPPEGSTAVVFGIINILGSDRPIVSNNVIRCSGWVAQAQYNLTAIVFNKCQEPQSINDFIHGTEYALYEQGLDTRPQHSEIVGAYANTELGFFDPESASLYVTHRVMPSVGPVSRGVIVGDLTQNAASGSSVIGAGTQAITITNELVMSDSVVLATVAGVDATLNSVSVTTSTGGFVLTGNASATADTAINWRLIG